MALCGAVTSLPPSGPVGDWVDRRHDRPRRRLDGGEPAGGRRGSRGDRPRQGQVEGDGSMTAVESRRRPGAAETPAASRRRCSPCCTSTRPPMRRQGGGRRRHPPLHVLRRARTARTSRSASRDSSADRLRGDRGRGVRGVITTNDDGEGAAVPLDSRDGGRRPVTAALHRWRTSRRTASTRPQGRRFSPAISRTRA